jgi:ferric-dicitrate binding protein FerR (iron transport regulator)
LSEVPDPGAKAEALIREEAEARVWTAEDSHGRHQSKLRRTLSRWASSSDQHARELRQTVRESGLSSIADAPDRTMVKLSGTLRTVTLRPRGGVPALEAELFDGSGAITLVWLGRRQITGIGPGRQLEVEGRIGVQEGVRVMYNPRYELRA